MLEELKVVKVEPRMALVEPTKRKVVVKSQVIGMTGKILNTSPSREKLCRNSQRNKEKLKLT